VKREDFSSLKRDVKEGKTRNRGRKLLEKKIVGDCREISRQGENYQKGSTGGEKGGLAGKVENPLSDVSARL